ncbi:MAG: thiamine ABC transporter substrate binding subunit [Candidatus Heimdallarchaeota archaeon]
MALSRESRRLLIGATIVLVVIVAVAIVTLSRRPEERTLNIYTYDSLLKWGYDEASGIGTPYKEIFAAVFSAFEQEHGITIQVTEFESTGTMIEQLVREKESPIADVVIGIDNLDIITLKEANVLKPYTPITLNNIPTRLITALDPEHYVVPYDFGVIALVYDAVALTAESYPELQADLTLADLTMDKYRSTFVIENPLTSSPGKSFLLWQIGIYEKVLHQSWQDWWRAMTEGDGVFIASGWTEAFERVFFEETDDHLVVSYGTDLAYNAFFEYGSNAHITLSHEQGNTYSWFQVEGLGLINGAQHEKFAKQFIDWFLTEPVQIYFPTNNWMYPANQNVKLPQVFVEHAVHPDEVSLVNNLFSQEEIALNLKDWLQEWQTIVMG